MAAGLENVGDLAHGHRARADVAQPLVDWQLFVLAGTPFTRQDLAALLAKLANNPRAAAA